MTTKDAFTAAAQQSWKDADEHHLARFNEFMASPGAARPKPYQARLRADRVRPTISVSCRGHEIGSVELRRNHWYIVADTRVMNQLGPSMHESLHTCLIRLCGAHDDVHGALSSPMTPPAPTPPAVLMQGWKARDTAGVGKSSQWTLFRNGVPTHRARASQQGGLGKVWFASAIPPAELGPIGPYDTAQEAMDAVDLRLALES